MSLGTAHIQFSCQSFSASICSQPSLAPQPGQGLGRISRDLRVWLYGKCALFQGRVMENLRDFKTSFPSHVWWLWRPGVRLLCVSDHVLQTSLGYMNRSRHRSHALSMSLGTEDYRVQMRESLSLPLGMRRGPWTSSSRQACLQSTATRIHTKHPVAGLTWPPKATRGQATNSLWQSYV